LETGFVNRGFGNRIHRLHQFADTVLLKLVVLELFATDVEERKRVHIAEDRRNLSGKNV